MFLGKLFGTALEFGDHMPKSSAGSSAEARFSEASPVATNQPRSENPWRLEHFWTMCSSFLSQAFRLEAINIPFCLILGSRFTGTRRFCGNRRRSGSRDVSVSLSPRTARRSTHLPLNKSAIVQQ